MLCLWVKVIRAGEVDLFGLLLVCRESWVVDVWFAIVVAKG